ncbi:MAG: cobalamin-dependent protein [Gemmatimonadota bacterium]|nr:cobalamin-dependent protein [Gemmatimonadota bacterium]
MKRRVAPATAMARHPIAVAAERTGLTQDVLRVWERRYGAVTPLRSSGGQRLYSDADIERLRLMHATSRAGRSIGQIAGLSTASLAQMAEEDSAAREVRESRATSSDASDVVTAGLALTRSLEAAQLEDALRRAAATMGVSAFLETVAAPLMRRVGDEWHAGRLTPAQEHLASSAVHDIILEMMRGFAQRDGAPRVLVATPAGERHVIGAAIVGATAAAEGWNVVYLGADLAAADIATAAVAAGARVVALSIVYVSERAPLMREMRGLRAQLPKEVVVIVGGAGASQLEPALAKLGVRVATSVAELEGQLRTTQ